MSKQALTPHERLLIMQAVTWIKTINDARPAGSPPSYPVAADIDSSALFKRIRQGLPPMPWAPPTRHGHPAYELIENARGQHRVQVAAKEPASAEIAVDGATWRRLASGKHGEQYLAFGRWPLSYRLRALEQPRWPSLPPDLDQGPGHEVVRFEDGRLVAKELLRRTRDERETQWWLQCVSPLNERLYLAGERLALDDPDHFRPVATAPGADAGAQAFSCRLRQGATVFFPMVRDPWTGVSRHLAAAVADADEIPAPWRQGWLEGRSPFEFLPAAETWQVFELDADGQPVSGWRTDRREDLLPMAPPE